MAGRKRKATDDKGTSPINSSAPFSSSSGRTDSPAVVAASALPLPPPQPLAEEMMEGIANSSTNNNKKRGRTDANAIGSISVVAGGGGGGPATSTSSTFYDKQLKDLESELREIKNKSNTELLEKIAQIEAKRNREVSEARLLKELRAKELESIHDYQVKEANDVCQIQVRDVTTRMLADVEESIRKIKELRDGKRGKGTATNMAMAVGDDENGMAGGGGTMDEAMEGSDDVGTLSQQSATTTSEPSRSTTRAAAKALASGIPLVRSVDSGSIKFAAPREDVASDIAKIHSQWLNMASNFFTESEIADILVRVEDGKLFVNESIFEKGMDIVADTTHEQFYGVISGIGESEVTFQLSSGTKSRVLISHLKSGRVTLKKDQARTDEKALGARDVS